VLKTQICQTRPQFVKPCEMVYM